MKMKKTRLAIIGVRGIPARYGGFETFAEELSTRLVDHGIDVTVFCDKSIDQTIGRYKGVALEYVSSPLKGVVGRSMYEITCILRASRRFDVIYILGYGSSYFAFLPRLFGTRVWINPDGLEWKRGKWKLPVKLGLLILEAGSLLTPDVLIFDSESIRKSVIKRYTKVPKNYVIGYGAHLVENSSVSHIEEYPVIPNDYYLVVSRLEPENHVFEILKGFSKSSTSSSLVVVGDISSKTNYIQKLLSVRDDRIIFVGSVYDKTKLSALRFFSKAYFHGHSVGGTNPSLLESLGCGNIVIAHRNDFNIEVAQDAAFYFSMSSDIPKILSMIESLSPEELDIKKDFAYRRIREKYNWNMITSQYLRLLQSF